MASYTAMPNGSCRVLIRRKALGKLCKTFKTESEAREWAEAEEADMLVRVLNRPATANKPKGLTLAEAFDDYQDGPGFKRKAESSKKREKQAAKAVLRHLGSLTLAAIDRIRVQRFIDKRCKEKNRSGEALAGDTIYKEKELLSAVFRWAIPRGYATENPAKTGIEMPACKVREGRITVEQESALYDAAWEYIVPKGKGHPPNPNLFMWFQFVMITGTRPGEAAKIELAWVNLAGREIAIPRNSHKNRKPRIILLTDIGFNTVRDQLDYATEQGSKYLFFSKSNGVYKPYAYAKPFKAICKRAGLPDDTVAHLMRHELVSRIFERTTLSDSQVASLVGDVHPLSLRPYTHLRANALRPKLAEFEEALNAVKSDLYGREKAAADTKELLDKMRAR